MGVKSSLQVYLQCYFLGGMLIFAYILVRRTSQSDAAHSVKVLAVYVPVDRYIHCALLATEVCHIKSKVWYVFWKDEELKYNTKLSTMNWHRARSLQMVTLLTCI
jgi:hypothetical protein